MSEQEQLMQALRHFARTISLGYDISDVLHDLTAQVTATLGIAGAGVSLLEGDVLRFATTDTERLATLEHSQEESGEGPCRDAARTGERVVVADLAATGERWPGYAGTAASLDVHAAAALPLFAGGRFIGTLDLYDGRPREWSEQDLDTAQVFADIAAGYVENASRLHEQLRVNEQLQHALDSRVVIEQAKGIISAHREITVDEAFQTLRRYATDHRATLRSVAEAVVTLDLRP